MPSTLPLWANAFGRDYFNGVERKDELISLLSQFEDNSYGNDMMPCFYLHKFERYGQTYVVKLWCGYDEDVEKYGDSLVASISLCDEDGQFIADFGNIEKLALACGSSQPAPEKQTDNSIVDALKFISESSMPKELEGGFFSKFILPEVAS